MTIEELAIHGKCAYLRGAYDLSITQPNTPTSIKRSGHTLTILRKEPDGRWRLARDANLPGCQSV